MSTRVRVVGFVAALVAVLGITLGAGRLIGPVGPFGPGDEVAGMAGHDEGTRAGGSGGHVESGGHDEGDAGGHAALPGGLQTSQDGYSLRLDPDQYAAGPKGPLTFVIEGPYGKPVTAYDVEHEKELHLIVVRRDFGSFQHVHPARTADGTWSVPLELTPGTWRVLADFRPKGGDAMTLGADLFVPGSYVAAQSPRDDLRTATVDGYTVTLVGDLTPGSDSALTLAVSRGGTPVTDLDPYLGAYGHLVALRTGDLAYLHVHPEGHPGDGTTRPGPDVTFGAEVPTSGTYRLFLDFKHAGVVRTAAFTVTAGTPLEPWKEDALR